MEIKNSFISTGADVEIELPSGVDWMEVVNETKAAAVGVANIVIGGRWIKGSATSYGNKIVKTHGFYTLEERALEASNGFHYLDSSRGILGASNAGITAISNAAPPVVSLASTTGITEGSIVRMGKVTGALQFNGVDFTVGTVNVDTDIELKYAPTIVAGTTGNLYPVIAEDRFYPRNRYIKSITAGVNSCVIVLTVTHSYTVGEEVRVRVPYAFGMTEVSEKVGTITAIDATANSITVDIDITGFTAFAWPTTAYLGEYAQVISVSESPMDSAFTGMLLKGTGDGQCIAGATGDLISYIAHVSDY